MRRSFVQRQNIVQESKVRWQRVLRPAQRNVVFHSEVDFSYSSFGVNLECEETDFVGAALLIALECGTLLCPAVTFRWIAKFDLLRCTANAFFSEARFEDQASFRFARFGANLDLYRSGLLMSQSIDGLHPP